MRIKTLSLIATILLFTVSKGFSQIALPKSFRCVATADHYREYYFSDGTLKFHSEAWGREVEDPADLKDYIEDNYSKKLRFQKTKDGLYWASGKFNDRYQYVIIIPEALITVSVSSKSNGSEFSNHSTWLLQQVRNNRSAEKDFYFTNYKGQSCTN